MSSDDIRKKIAHVIIMSRINKVNKLTVTHVCKKVGISRKTLYKSYPDMLNAIKGYEDVDEQLFEQEISNQELYIKYNQKSEQLDKLKNSIDSYKEEFKNKTFTLLMKKDISIHNAEKESINLVNTSKQLNEKIKDIKHLEASLGVEREDNIKLKYENEQLKNSSSGIVEFINMKPNITSAMTQYKKNNEIKDYLNRLSFAVEQLVEDAIQRATNEEVNAIVIMHERYNVNDTSIKKKIFLPKGKYLFISIPIPQRTKRNEFLSELFKLKTPIIAIVAESSQSNQTLYRNNEKISELIPDKYLSIIDRNFQTPVISDGFDTITIVKVNQII
ncbi:hypothetical protein D5018_08530 [Parashewanella curva]|uniref:Uncharacterized protein n=1 Tax=Parashewanella curva TaxID=2338552 RepID=A0A3L8PXZ0_9GAMM|nr:hypothetical protein [Parashewanella curva]RLV60170.1 hypothetical protein D5018_08530 [Parashewanella curva]